MKRIILIFSILTTAINFSIAQNPEFQNTLKSLVDSVQAKKWGADLTDYANQLERIAWAETKEWLPYYWAAYCYVNKSYSEKESGKRDLYLGHAESLIGVAEKIAPENDEIEVMKASIASARLAVSPSIRWLTYGNTSSKALKKAQKINPANPRAKLLYYKTTNKIKQET